MYEDTPTPKEILMTVKGNILAESDKAVKFEVIDVAGELIEPTVEWFPISQIRKSFSSKNARDEDTLTVTQWILRKKDFI